MKLNMKIREGKYELPDADWKNVSSEAKDFLQKLLCVDPSKRMTAKAAREHPWIKVRGYHRFVESEPENWRRSLEPCPQEFTKIQRLSLIFIADVLAMSANCTVYCNTHDKAVALVSCLEVSCKEFALLSEVDRLGDDLSKSFVKSQGSCWEDSAVERC